MDEHEKSRTDLRERTKQFALRIVRLYAALPHKAEAQVIGRQLLRAGTSVGAHYREAFRSRSDAEYIAKIEGGLQELEESLYWLELLSDAQILSKKRLNDLYREGEQLVAILVSCSRKAKTRKRGVVTKSKE